jgi:hypothetical protein
MCTFFMPGGLNVEEVVGEVMKIDEVINVAEVMNSEEVTIKVEEVTNIEEVTIENFIIQGIIQFFVDEPSESPQSRSLIRGAPRAWLVIGLPRPPGRPSPLQVRRGP